MNKSDPLRQLWLAAVLLTRFPLPHLPQEAFEAAPRAVWAYPLVGFAVGMTGAAAGYLALMLGLPAVGAATLALGAMMLLTGAMHEDGLADVSDGFWGGFTPVRRLEIMRDSQIGTYGVLALMVTFVLRVSALSVLLGASWLALPAAAAASRGMMPIVMALLPYARSDGLSRSVGRPASATAVSGCAIGAVLAVLCVGSSAVIALCLAAGVTAGVALIAKRKIGGQTGDVLGAVQQVSEIAMLLCFAALV